MFYARLKVKLDDGRLVDRRVRLKAATLTEARIEHAMLRADPAEVADRQPHSPVAPVVAVLTAPTLREFIPVYLERARLSKRPSTVVTETISLRQWRADGCRRCR